MRDQLSPKWGHQTAPLPYSTVGSSNPWEVREREQQSQSLLPVEESMSKTIFVVHGHDDGRKQAVARVLAALTSQEPVILHEQPNRGQTIIEKFERHAHDARFVVVIATADDIGRAKNDTSDRPRASRTSCLSGGTSSAHWDARRSYCSTRMVSSCHPTCTVSSTSSWTNRACGSHTSPRRCEQKASTLTPTGCSRSWSAPAVR